MSDTVEKLALLVVGGVVTFCVQRILARCGDKRGQFRVYRLAFRGFPEFHRKLLFDGLTDDVWQNQIPPHLRDHCITFVFFLESVGRAVAKDVRITVHARNGAGIVAHTFLVAHTAICGRLDTKRVDDTEVVATWKYINPGDDIELHVLVTGIDDPDNVEIGVDGEGIEVTERFLLQKCVRAVVWAGNRPMSPAQQRNLAELEPSHASETTPGSPNRTSSPPTQ